MSPALVVLLRLGARSLRVHKLRSSCRSSASSSASAVVAMSSVGEGARRETLAQIAALGIDTMTVRAARGRARRGAGGRAPRRSALARWFPACRRWRRCA